MREFRGAVYAVVIFLSLGKWAAADCETNIKQLENLLSRSEPGTGAMADVPGTRVTSPIDGQQKDQEGSAGTQSNDTKKSQPMNSSAAQSHLSRARELEAAGNEAECENEVTKARVAFGAQ